MHPIVARTPPLGKNRDTVTVTRRRHRAATSSMLHDHQHIKQPESRRRDDEEVTGGYPTNM